MADDISTSSQVEKNEDLLGGLNISSTGEVSIPDKLIDQVIGQEHAREVVEKAAKKHRHVMMIGAPGTGKSMLAKAMTEMLPQEDLNDVLIYPNEDDENEPRVRTVPAGKGKEILEANKQEAEKQGQMRNVLKWVIVAVIAGYGLIAGDIILGVIAAAIVYFLFSYGSSSTEELSPKLLIDNSDNSEVPFEDATGAHAGALLGDVRHDPFQSGRMSTPPHNRVESGAIHNSDNGVLFIDEINTMDVRSQQKLMTAIQDGEFAITGQSERSSGAMVQTEPVPTDFIMVAAGNMDALENMHPALRDRIRGYGYEVYMNDKVDDSEETRQKYVQFIAQEVQQSNVPHFDRGAIKETILEARRRAGQKGKLTLRLRNLGGLIRVAGDIAAAEGENLVSREHVLRAKERAQSIEQQFVNDQIQTKKKYGVANSKGSEVGRVNGLAVMGDDSGILLPVMADVTPSQGPGRVIATGKLEEIAEEAVKNVSAIVKRLGGETLDGKDIHIQFVQTYEGVDGDSASVTVATAVISALTGVPVNQDLSMTGSLSVRGDVLPVGGVTHKIEAAVKSGVSKVIIPEANKNDVLIEDEYRDKVEIVTVSTLGDVLEESLNADDHWLSSVKERLNTVRKTGIGDLGIEM
jgi:Lon-like ATP-dependent protease